MKIDLVIIILVIVIVYVFLFYKDEAMADVGTNELKLGSWTIKESTNGHLVFIKEGTTYDNDYSKIQQDTGFVALSQDGNIWSNKSSGRGWLADNKLNVSGGTINGQLNVNGLLNMGNNIAMNDHRIGFRSVSDPNHFISYDGGIDGPSIGGNQNVGIYNAANPGNPRLRLGDWSISRLSGVGNCGHGAGSSLFIGNNNSKGMIISDLGTVEVNTAWGLQGIKC